MFLIRQSKIACCLAVPSITTIMLKEFQDRHDKNVKDKLTFKNGMGASLLSNKSNTIVLPLLLDWLRKSKGLN